MTIKLRAFIIVLCVGLFPAFQKLPFSSKPEIITIDRSGIKEISGIAESVVNKGILYVHEDNGHANFIHLITPAGKYYAKINLGKSRNVDWEDISVGPGPQKGTSYVYVGDVGNNKGRRDVVTIWRFKERVVKKDQKLEVTDAEPLRFTYPSKNLNAEALLVDPRTRDIYILSKEGEFAGIYRAPYPQSTSKTTTLIRMGQLPFKMVTGADISPNGSEILVRNEEKIWYFRRLSNQSVTQSLKARGLSLPFKPEPQGEAVCFSRTRPGYYSATETPGKDVTTFSFYKRSR